MNHLEQLVSEWLAFRGYFVRTGVRVGPRERGGFEGELDVVAFHPGREHFLHIECSLDAVSQVEREKRFAAKFDRGRRFAADVFAGIVLPGTLDQAAVMTMVGKRSAAAGIGGGRLIATRELVLEIVHGLKGTSPLSGAVPETYPLVRTLQLAAAAQGSWEQPRVRLLPDVTKGEVAAMCTDAAEARESA